MSWSWSCSLDKMYFSYIALFPKCYIYRSQVSSFVLSVWLTSRSYSRQTFWIILNNILKVVRRESCDLQLNHKGNTKLAQNSHFKIFFKRRSCFSCWKSWNILCFSSVFDIFLICHLVYAQQTLICLSMTRFI